MAVVLAAAVSACGNGNPARPSPTSSARPEAPAPTATATATASAAGAASSGAPAPSANQPASPFAGAWEGTFNAKKGSVTVPSGVKDAERSSDTGAAATGPGAARVVVSPSGDVSGSISGALGRATLSGRVEVEPERTLLRATVMPDDPSSREAMTGVLVGVLKEGAFAVELHAAGPDATVVREAAFELHRKQ